MKHRKPFNRDRTKPRAIIDGNTNKQLTSDTIFTKKIRILFQLSGLDPEFF